jgi:hypothetical protein
MNHFPHGVTTLCGCRVHAHDRRRHFNTMTRKQSEN